MCVKEAYLCMEKRPFIYVKEAYSYICHVCSLHHGDEPAATPFKMDTRAYFRGLTEV